jgi:hypothetical protein
MYRNYLHVGFPFTHTAFLPCIHMILMTHAALDEDAFEDLEDLLEDDFAFFGA